MAKWFVNVLLGELKDRALHETRTDGKALGVLVKRQRKCDLVLGGQEGVDRSLGDRWRYR